MNPRLVNAAAGVICAAQKVDRTPAGIAFALESAHLLQSPETAAELVALRKRAAEMQARIDELVKQRDGALVDLASVPDTYVDCRVCGAGRLAGKPCGICEFNARMTAEAGEPA